MGIFWSNAAEPTDPVFLQQLDLLAPINHRAFAQCVVKPYGVLGVGEANANAGHSQKPGTAIDAVIVHPLEPRDVQRSGPPKQQGASGAVYTWLGARVSGGLPQRVREHFLTNASTADEMTRRAIYHRYGQGQHVVHVIGPMLRDLEKSIQDLTETYANVLRQYCEALAMSSQQSGRGGLDTPLTLRLPPISSDGLKENPALSAHGGDIFWSALAIAIERLPPALASQLQQAKVEVCIYRTQHVKWFDDVLSTKHKVLADRSCLQIGEGRAAMPPQNGSFDWIRKENDNRSRLQRLAAASTTMQAVVDGGYQLKSSPKAELKHIEQMISLTRVVCAGYDSELNPSIEPIAGVRVVPAPEDAIVMDVAVQLTKAGKRVVAVNAASGHHVGGGVLTGGRHALEEAFCMMSTLLKSLQHAQHQHGGQDGPYIPEDGCILTQHVEVFREPTATGYAFLHEPVALHAVASVAMYNCNRRVRDSPMDAPIEEAAYQRGVRAKLSAVLKAAGECGADALVCPDIGCGVFGNDPAVVGFLLGQALREGPCCVPEVHVTGGPAFAGAVEQALHGPAGQRAPQRPAARDPPARR